MAAVRGLGAQVGAGMPRGEDAHASVLLHLWDELEERVRQQSSNGQGDEVSEHAAEKRSLCAGQDEDSQERGQVNQRDTEKATAPHCGQEQTRAVITAGGVLLLLGVRAPPL